MDVYVAWLSPYLKAMSAVFVLAGLYIIFFMIKKILLWSPPVLQPLSSKINLQGISFIVFFTIWWFLLDLPEFNSQILLVKVCWSLMIFFAILILFDVLNYLFFEYYALHVRGVKVPQIISNLVRALYFLGILLFILGGVLKKDIRPFLTGSAILTAIIGLALQDTIGNLFSGLALHISRPFNIGHWIKFANFEGTVAKADWRATTIKTRQEDYVTIPNSQLAKVEIINFSAPTAIHGQSVEVGVRYNHPPGKIKKVLIKAALTTEGVVKEMIPDVYLEKYSDFSINYRMRYFIDNYRAAEIIKSAVMERIWYLFRRENIEIPFPIRDVYIKRETEKVNMPYLKSMLAHIDFLEGLTEEELQDVAMRLKTVMYSSGEEILRQGDPGDTFYIINKGSVRVIAKNEKGEIFLTQDLHEGSFFGEISVLTGEPRTATIVAVSDVELFVLDKTDFEHLLKKYPHMDRHISKKIAARQKHTYEQMEVTRSSIIEGHTPEGAQKAEETLSSQILSKIRSFFSIR